MKLKGMVIAASLAGAGSAFAQSNVTLYGVADINITGALEREVQITIDPVLLRKYGIGLAQVATMLKSENFNLPSGQVNNRASEITLRTTNAFTTAAELERLPVIAAGGRQVTLGDLGTVIDGVKEQRAKSWLNGKSGH